MAKKNTITLPDGTVVSHKKPLKEQMYKYRWFYLMFLPVFIFVVVFYYLPMFGIVYSFTEYKLIEDPVWTGFKNFETLFSKPMFWRAFKNTLFLSISKLSPSSQGLVNSFLVSIGVVEKGSEIYFLGSLKWWTPAFFVINVWKDTGWQTIIIMATLVGISQEIYEAAGIDGAGRWKKMWYITMPALANTIITVIILNLAKVLNLFESVFVLQNDAVMEKAKVIQTYVYNQTFNSGGIPNYGYTTAVGLFKSLVGCVLVLICNYISKKVRNGRGIV